MPLLDGATAVEGHSECLDLQGPVEGVGAAPRALAVDEVVAEEPEAEGLIALPTHFLQIPLLEELAVRGREAGDDFLLTSHVEGRHHKGGLDLQKLLEVLLVLHHILHIAHHGSYRRQRGGEWGVVRMIGRRDSQKLLKEIQVQGRLVSGPFHFIGEGAGILL